MNVLFVSISCIPDVNMHSISLDLLREFQRGGHKICILCALEKNDPQATYVSDESGMKIVRVRIGGNKKANIFEKGITTLLEPYKYIAAIKKYCFDEKFDMVLYPTPPITQVKTVEYIKRRDGAKSYLLLKDIFPQNAVDIGIMTKRGIKGLLYKHFRRVEKKLYQVSDYIGCMSEANVKYVLNHNSEVNPNKVEVCPNSIEVIDKSVDTETKIIIRKKYGIPLDKKVFIYGGNLGKPQGISYIIDCLRAIRDIEEILFLIVGDGTEYKKLEDYSKMTGQRNFRLMKRLPKEDYDNMVGACDVGLIFLDHRFTIPNYPSRLLAYMQAKIPVLAVTDPNTDIGKTIVDGGFGWWCESNDYRVFRKKIEEICYSSNKELGTKAYEYLLNNFNAENSYKTISKHML